MLSFNLDALIAAIVVVSSSITHDCHHRVLACALSSIVARYTLSRRILTLLLLLLLLVGSNFESKLNCHVLLLISRALRQN